MDDNPKKGSLRGRGRDIMRGPHDDASRSEADDRRSGSWLPESQDEPEEEPYFENEEALLRWMEADPEAHRTTAIEDSLPPQDIPGTSELYPDPDFDSIFGSEDTPRKRTAEPSLPAIRQQREDDLPEIEPELLPDDVPTMRMPTGKRKFETQTLDDIFAEEDPTFDELFGEVEGEGEPAVPGQVGMESRFAELPLPQTSDLFTEEEPVEALAEAPDDDDFYLEDRDTDTLPTLAEAEELFADTEPTAPEADDFFAQEAVPEPDFEDIGEPEMDLFASEDSENELEAVPRPYGMAKPMRAENELPEPEPEGSDAVVNLDDLDEPAFKADRRSRQMMHEVHEDGDFESYAASLDDTMPSEATAPMEQEVHAAAPADWLDDVEDLEPEEVSASAEADARQEVEDFIAMLEDEEPETVALPADDFGFDEKTEPTFSESALEMEPEAEQYTEDDGYGFEDDAYGFEEEPEISTRGDFSFDDEPEPALADAAYDSDDDDEFGFPEPLAPQSREFRQVPPPPTVPESRFSAIDNAWESVEEAPIEDEVEEPLEAESFISMLEAEEDEPQDKEEIPELVDLTVRESAPQSYGLAPEITKFSVQPVIHTGGSFLHEEAIPPAESDTQPVNLHAAALHHTVLDRLTPSEPEVLPPGQGIPFDIYDDVEDDENSGQRFESALESAGAAPVQEATTRGSGLLVTDEDTETAPADPFNQRVPRRPARELFKPNESAQDDDLIRMFVDDNRMRELFAQIEALQEEVVQNVRGERGNTDTYQEELLEASNLLMQGRQNYDEARAITYRVRADINRERRVDADIAKYRPLLTNVYIGLAIFIVVLALLGQLFISFTESIGASFIAYGYYPAIFGTIGAWLAGVTAIYRHTIVQRDFDPNHVNWYVLNPPIGLLSGFLAYVVLLIPNSSALSSNFESIGSSPFTWFTAVLVGMNQNALWNLFNSTRQRFSSTGNNGREE